MVKLCSPAARRGRYTQGNVQQAPEQAGPYMYEREEQGQMDPFYCLFSFKGPSYFKHQSACVSVCLFVCVCGGGWGALVLCNWI